MTVSPFRTSWDRIRRADEHRDAFGRAWERFCEEHPYAPRAHVADDGEGTIWLDCEPLPPILSLLLGEFLYQLRAALDAAVYDAAMVESGQDPPPKEQQLMFIVCASEADFKKQAWHLGDLSENSRGIVESMQPYNAIHYPPDLRNLHGALDMLHDWARKDRHRNLHVVGSWASGANPLLDLPDGVTCQQLCVAPDGVLERDSEVATFSLAGWRRGMHINANPNLMIDITADELPLPRDAEDTLSNRTRHMIQAVRAVVGSLAERNGFPNSESDSQVTWSQPPSTPGRVADGPE